MRISDWSSDVCSSDLGGIVLAIIVLALLWDWNWFKPLVEHEASSALGRSVTLQHFDVKMRWHPWFIADSIAIANPPEFPDDSNLTTIERLAIHLNRWAWLDGKRVVWGRSVVLRLDLGGTCVNKKKKNRKTIIK